MTIHIFAQAFGEKTYKPNEPLSQSIPYSLQKINKKGW